MIQCTVSKHLRNLNLMTGLKKLWVLSKRLISLRERHFVEPSAAHARTRYFGTTALDYDANRERTTEWKREHAAVDYLLSTVSPKSQILDIPVGTGRFAALYAKYRLHVTGMDVSSDMLSLARHKLTREKVSAKILLGNIFSIDLPDKSIDYAVCVRFLNLIDANELQRALRELARVTRGDIIAGIMHDERARVQEYWRVHSSNDLDRALNVASLNIRDQIAVSAEGLYIMRLVNGTVMAG